MHLVQPVYLVAAVKLCAFFGVFVCALCEALAAANGGAAAVFCGTVCWAAALGSFFLGRMWCFWCFGQPTSAVLKCPWHLTQWAAARAGAPVAPNNTSNEPTLTQAVITEGAGKDTPASRQPHRQKNLPICATYPVLQAARPCLLLLLLSVWPRSCGRRLRSSFCACGRCRRDTPCSC